MRDCEQGEQSERCEHCEILVSAWHDGELDRSGQVEMLDHLVGCAGCRDFYLAARGLDGLVAAVRAPAAAEEPSPEVWKRIERSARSGESARGGGERPWMLRFPVRAWAAAAAAAVLLILFGPPLVRNRISSDSPAPAGAEIRLGENPAGMDDARFVELTRAVLGADRRYREAFYEVMKQVVQDTQGGEPSMDGLLPPGEGRGSPESSESVRGPS